MNELISVDGVILPNTPLTDAQIIDAINKLKIPHFRGVFCRDELPHKVNVNECGIINLDNSRGMGTHWCCWFKMTALNTTSTVTVCSLQTRLFDI